MYVSLVRPYLEYAVKAWNPHTQADIGKVERVQKRATRTPTGFEDKERLKGVSLTTLKDRRLRGDLIEMYRVIRSRESIE